jgi:hypothetical protein
MSVERNADEERILAMVAEGKISEAEARELIAALHERPRASIWVNPFEHVAGPAGLAAALILGCAGIAFAPFGIRFSGPFDLHPHAGAIPWATAIADWVTYLPVPALSFWLAARLAGRPRVRLVDFVTLVGVLRLVYLGLALLTLGVKFPKIGERPTASLYLFIVVVLASIIWYFVMLTRGYKTASGLTGKRFVTSFVVAVIACELASSLVLHRLT